MSAQSLTAYLDENQIRYNTITHSPAFTAQEIAHSAHIPGGELAKTVMVKLDGKMVEAVLPASHQLDLESFRTTTGAEKVELATETEFEGIFPDCEVGAMPPCGNIYGVDVYVSPSLKSGRQILFNAGSHSELISMLYKDYEKLVQPSVVPLSRSERA
jgi:Ala-tRNA(Pro) deacylase